MIIDMDLAEEPGAKTYFVIPRPVLQRLLDGKTKGLAIRPLALSAPASLPRIRSGQSAATLHFNVER